MARRRILLTVDLLSEALARRGLSSTEAEAERLRLSLGLPDRDAEIDDDAAAAACRSLRASDAFSRSGAASLARSVPGLRCATSPDGSLSWSILVRIPLLDDGRMEIRLQASPGEAAEGILSAMATRNDPSWRLRDLKVAVAAVEASVEAALEAAVRRVRDWLRRDLSEPSLDGTAYVAHLDHAFRSRILPAGPTAGDLVVAKFQELRQRARSHVTRTSPDRRLVERAGFRTYVDRFAAARRLGRRLVFHMGPTNSGKTYAALEILAAAGGGAYLAPLRLLALENYEALRDRGLRAGMVTGEEVLGEPLPTHVSRTIEAADLTRTVDVAVIDEIQMITDPDRGWAWTNALLGIPARTVVLCGSEDALPYLRRAAAATGERLDVVAFQRKTPLLVQEAAVPLEDVKAGDAVVAFSRQAVHDAREALVALGHSVAVIYGALSPEVRRAEATRFREREAEVLVTTDAVGMGLNLGPLERVVFASVRKWDGKADRALTNPEIRQIAGRAGRFGHQDAGYVAAVDAEALAPIRAALAGAPAAPAEDDRFYVRPDIVALSAVADELGTESLGEVLDHFARSAFYEGSPFQPSDLDDTIRLAALVDRTRLPFAEKHAFSISPVDLRDRISLAVLENWIHVRATGGYAPALRTPREADLETHERTVRLCGAYLWLAKRFPDTFDEVDATRRTRTAANLAIGRALAETAVRRTRARPPAQRGARTAENLSSAQSA